MTTKAPTKKWLTKAVELEADCDISAGPALPRVKATASSHTTNGAAQRTRKAATNPRTTRRRG